MCVCVYIYIYRERERGSCKHRIRVRGRLQLLRKGMDTAFPPAVALDFLLGVLRRRRAAVPGLTSLGLGFRV